MMPLDEIVNNQVSITHLMGTVKELEKMEQLVSTDENLLIGNQISSAIHILKELIDEITKTTLPEWDAWLQVEKEGKLK